MVAIRDLVAAATAGYVGLAANCPITNYQPSFPPNQTTLVAPSEEPNFLGLALGVQNYTCSSSSTYTWVPSPLPSFEVIHIDAFFHCRSIGAVAEIIDASCLATTSEFSTIQNDLYTVWTQVVPDSVSIQDIIDYFHQANTPAILGQHFFQPNPVTGSGVSPVWDFRSNPRFAGNDNAYVLGAVNGSIPSPTDPTDDVAWLHVVNVQGGLASDIFRYDTVGGQPPTSVSPSAPLFCLQSYGVLSDTYSARPAPMATFPSNMLPSMVSSRPTTTILWLVQLIRILTAYYGGSVN